MKLRPLILSISLLIPVAPALAGWSTGIKDDDGGNTSNPPEIKGPQDGWSKVSDIQESDGTVNVPGCNDPHVVAIVREHIVNAENDRFNQSAGGGMTGSVIEGLDIQDNTIWAHSTFDDRVVCSMTARLEMPMVGYEKWEFETFSEDGKKLVFFYSPEEDASSQ